MPSGAGKSAGAPPGTDSRTGTKDSGYDLEDQAARCHPLERAHPGPPSRLTRTPRARGLAALRPTASSGGKIQTANDPKLEDKVRDIVGLSLNPATGLWCLSRNERARFRPSTARLPVCLRPGLPNGNSAKRHGPTTLFAAFNILNGKVIGRCLPRSSLHRIHPISQSAGTRGSTRSGRSPGHG